ncbi:MAG: hypothetical protein CME04_16305 [Gemmatimonadaceae bacterium]|jgi:outer membrane protein assembly factor BamB|nr:hypothetical protein [Gemmatimonadaceae bacterium]
MHGVSVTGEREMKISGKYLGLLCLLAGWSASPVIDKGVVYVGSADGSMYALH